MGSGGASRRCRRISALLCLALGAACAREPALPNVVLLIGDDHGWPDFGFMGSPVARTPHLDRLAAEGTVFTHAFNTASTCRPSLRSLLTGLHRVQVNAALRGGREGRANAAFQIERFVTLPERLAERGYASFEGGKYWEGHYARAGFSEGLADPAAPGAEALPPLHRASGGLGLALGRGTLDPLWKFIDASEDAPFFVWLAPMLPHVPFDAPSSLVDPYLRAGLRPRVAGYYANVGRFDAVVGELVDGLERRGLRERTLVVYLADNGWDVHTELPAPDRFQVGGARGKRTPYELGFRTPLVLSWPEHLPAGRSDARLVSTLDAVATILDVAGAAPLPHSDGRSLLPLLRGEGDFQRRYVAATIGRLRDDPASVMAARVDRGGFLRTLRWRYVVQGDGDREELYRIDQDPFELRDVAGEHPEELARLREELSAWRAALVAPYQAPSGEGVDAR